MLDTAHMRLDKAYVFDWIRAATTRPEMYAQSASSLEDQALLLLRLIDTKTSYIYKYNRYIIDNLGGYGGASAYYNHDIKATASFLGGFLTHLEKSGT